MDTIILKRECAKCRSIFVVKYPKQNMCSVCNDAHEPNVTRHTKNWTTDQGYRALVAAIIKQAILDFRTGSIIEKVGALLFLTSSDCFDYMEYLGIAQYSVYKIITMSDISEKRGNPVNDEEDNIDLETIFNKMSPQEVTKMEKLIVKAIIKAKTEVISKRKYYKVSKKLTEKLEA